MIASNAGKKADNVSKKCVGICKQAINLRTRDLFLLIMVIAYFSFITCIRHLRQSNSNGNRSKPCGWPSPPEKRKNK